MPTVVVTHTEPFHVSKAIATLDYVSAGRAGVRVQVGARADTAAHFGRRQFRPIDRSRLDDPEVRQQVAVSHPRVVVGDGLAGNAFISGVARQPEAQGRMIPWLFTIVGLVEAMYFINLAFMALFVFVFGKSV